MCGAKKKLPITDSPEGPAAKRAHIPSPPPEDDAANFPGIHSQTYGSKYSDHAYGQFGSSDGTEVLKYPIGQRIGRCTGGQATCVSGHIALAVAVQLRRSMGYEAKVDSRRHPVAVIYTGSVDRPSSHRRHTLFTSMTFHFSVSHPSENKKYAKGS